MLSPVRVTPPAALPVTLAEAKAHLRVDHGDEDVRITGLIGAETAKLDARGLLGRAIVTQTWLAPFYDFSDLLLPFGPVQSVQSVEYWNGTSMVPVTAPAGGFPLVKTDLGWRVANARGSSWPSATWHEDGAVFVTFVVGNNVADVPEDIKLLIKIGAQMSYDADLALQPAYNHYLNSCRLFTV